MRNMTRQEWYTSVGDLRLILRGPTSAVGKFRRVRGSGYLTYIYNLKSDNVIATIDRGRGLIRVRPNSLYAPVIREWAKSNRSVVIDSKTLGNFTEIQRESARHMPESRPTFNSRPNMTSAQQLAELSVAQGTARPIFTCNSTTSII